MKDENWRIGNVNNAEEWMDFSPREELVPAQQSRERDGFDSSLDTVYML